MNAPIDPRRDDDALREEFADVRRAYAGLGDEPVPPSLDASVLQGARAAVRPTRARSRWLVPVSLAASVVLAVGVALDVRHESRHEVASEHSAPPRATASDEADVTTGPVANGAAPKHGVVDTAAPTLATDVVPPPERAAAPLSASAPGTHAAATPRTTTGASAERRATPPAEEPAHAAAALAPPPAAPAAAPAEDAAVAAERSLAAPPLAPDAWLAKIDALRREGRTAEAEAELARFVQAYPDHPRASPPR